MKYTFFTILCIACTTAFAQSKLAKQATWQQRVNYQIEVSLNDVNHTLDAVEKMEYINNSPDALTEIWIHLWPNAYQDLETPFAKQKMENGELDFYYNKVEDLGYISNLSFTINGDSVEVKPGPSADVVYLKLKKPLLPGEYCIIRTPFHVKIPKNVSRLGHIGNTYQITQWYPKPAVYDVNGWNPMPYLNQGEFYSDFGTFDVKITLPKKYILAASGNLKDKATTDSLNIYHYQLDKVHDFAWFADKDFKIAEDTVQLASGRIVTCKMYYQSEKDNGLKYIKSAIKFRSQEIGEYPYDVASAVVGTLVAGGGMEYPTITIVNGGDEFTIEHEVGHNWFYGILASNERMYPWMDEGMNTYYDNQYITWKAQLNNEPKVAAAKGRVNVNLDQFTGYHYSSYKTLFDHIYRVQARTGYDQAIELPSTEYTDLNYGAMVYGKTSLAVEYLQHALGDSIFSLCIKSYYETWKFKHPLPADMREVFEKISKKNLGWFFDDLIKTTGVIDYKIEGIYTPTERPNYWIVDVKNEGDIAGPLFISSMRGDSIVQSFVIEGFKGSKSIGFEKGNFDRVMIDPNGWIPEVRRKNNTIRTKGMFKKIEPVRFKFLPDLELSKRSSIYYTPLYGWNNYTGSMLGLALYNEFSPPKKISWVLAPLYSFRNNTLNGYASIQRNILFRNESTHGIELKLEVFKYDYNYQEARNLYRNDTGQLIPSAQLLAFNSKYIKWAPSFKINIQNSSPRSTATSYLYGRASIVAFDEVTSGYDKDSNYIYSNSNVKNNFYFMGFVKDNQRALNPYKNSLEIELFKSYQKLSFEFKGGFNLNDAKRKLNYRVFVTGMYYNKLQNPQGIDPRYHLRPTSVGRFDYAFDYSLMGRSENPFLKNNILSRQVLNNGGFIKVASNLLTSDSWLSALNISYPLPSKIPFRVYGDLVFYNSYNQLITSSATTISRSPELIYNIGLSWGIIPGKFEIYFPLAMSANLKLFTQGMSYMQKISFMLNLKELNPLLLKKKITKLLG
jgi:hypothetical protein